MPGSKRNTSSFPGRDGWCTVVDTPVRSRIRRLTVTAGTWTRDMGTETTDGAIGLIMGGGKARFKHLRILVSDEQLVMEGATAH